MTHAGLFSANAKEWKKISTISLTLIFNALPVGVSSVTSNAAIIIMCDQNKINKAHT